MPPRSGAKSAGPPQTAGGEPPTFETALARLEDIVERLEHGEITLDESLAAFKEGSGLVRLCLERLSAAETAVQQLMAGEGGSPVLKPAVLDGDTGTDPDA